MIFQLGIVDSTSIHEKNYNKAFLSKSIEELQFCLEYQHFLTLQHKELQKVSCFILGEELFQKRAFCIYLSSLTICFRTVVIND